MERFRAFLSKGIRLTLEVAIRIPGDRRSADVVANDGQGNVLIEAETRVDDVQAVVRRARGKQRDLGCRCVILVLADTRHHRELVRQERAFEPGFRVATRADRARLGTGRLQMDDLVLLV
jgi:hypothetical protein